MPHAKSQRRQETYSSGTLSSRPFDLLCDFAPLREAQANAANRELRISSLNHGQLNLVQKEGFCFRTVPKSVPYILIQWFETKCDTKLASCKNPTDLNERIENDLPMAIDSPRKSVVAQCWLASNCLSESYILAWFIGFALACHLFIYWSCRQWLSQNRSGRECRTSLS